MGMVFGTMIVGANDPIPKHKRGRGSSILAVCLILLLFLTQAFGANVCNTAGGGGGRNMMHAGEEFDPMHEDVSYDDNDGDL
ncbi:uncharacterized protein LOC111830178 [Capsella rubella]|uniref:uncharacterized protein LOC111830178 n=1 Tax=Capsella rubella TaxID=81985 RepID=UPI000CD51151|nr:uncharacterized protein LOC111830178 [Capsella rubella]